jgi:hypothetical protein
MGWSRQRLQASQQCAQCHAKVVGATQVEPPHPISDSRNQLWDCPISYQTK